MKTLKNKLNYYRDILTQLNVNAEECLMVGNDDCCTLIPYPDGTA